METTIKIILAGLLAWASAEIGLITPWVVILVVAWLCDFATGTAVVMATRQGEWSWESAVWGFGKRVLSLTLVFVGAVIDYAMAQGVLITDVVTVPKGLFALAAMLWLIISELLSIIQNMSVLGYEIPFLTRIIETWRDKTKGDDK